MGTQKKEFDNLNSGWMEEQIQKNPMQYFAFLDGLFEPRFSVGQIGISRQELQYWRKTELIDSIESDTRSWVKVSFFDYCWLKLIAEMRKLFIPIDHIKKVREVLFSYDVEEFNKQAKLDFNRLKSSPETDPLVLDIIQNIENDDPELYKEAFKHTSYFFFILLDLIRKDSPASLIIDINGNCSLLLLNESVELDKLPEIISLFDESFTAIRLNKLLDEFYSNPRIRETHVKELFRLTDKESKILQLLRKESIKEIRVRLGDKGKGIVMVEVVEEKNINSVKEKIRAILDKEKVQNIRISSFEGNLLLFEETTKMKL